MIILVTNTPLFKTPCPQGAGKLISNAEKSPKWPPQGAVPANESAIPPKPCYAPFLTFSLALLQVQVESPHAEILLASEKLEGQSFPTSILAEKHGTQGEFETLLVSPIDKPQCQFFHNKKGSIEPR
jgi:hypothetical protein